MTQTNFIIELYMSNKRKARDPVGERLERDLLAKKGYDMITNVRSGQYLRLNLTAEDEKQAEDIVVKMCNDLRIFNPVTQDLTILKVSKQD